MYLATSRMHLACISTASRLHLPRIPEQVLLAAAGGDLEALEPTLALHATLLRTLAPHATDELATVLLHTAATARSCNAPSLAASKLAEASALPLSAPMTVVAQWEHSQLLWLEESNGQPNARAMALAGARSLAARARPPPPPRIKISLDGDARRSTIVASERRSSMGRG